MSHAAAAALSCTATLYVSSGPCTSTVVGAAARARGQERLLPSGCGSASGPAPVRAQPQQLVKSSQAYPSVACLLASHGMVQEHAFAGSEAIMWVLVRATPYRRQ